ncbi:MAG: GMC family oxidoreductase [Hyphomicrobiaceae bacterium]|nr:GMC family oxidoreductase [Hyphomicrobiaceae bacterium]
MTNTHPGQDHRFDPATDLDSDILIIGSGMGGATFASALAESGVRIVMLEQGDFIADSPDNRDPDVVYGQMRFHSKLHWLDKNDQAFTPGNFEWVGGNTKFYGAVLYRFREADFGERRYEEGVSPAWPFGYSELQPWYEKAERLYKVRGQTGVDPSEPRGPYGYDYPPVPDEPAIADVRRRLERTGIKVSSLPLAVDIDAWTSRGKGPWDQYPDGSNTGKMDAESCALTIAVGNPGFKLIRNAEVQALELGKSSNRIESVTFTLGGETHQARAKLVVLAAGAVPSAALLLKSGLANTSDQVGRNFMNHVFSFLIAVNPFFSNTSSYQKTLSINHFYDEDNDTGKALGNMQLVGRLFPETLRFQEKNAPYWLLKWISRHGVDWFLQTEDIPKPDNRVVIKDGTTKLIWNRPHIPTHMAMVERAKKMFKTAGFPIQFHRLMGEDVPYHQCGTVRMGADPKTSVLNQNNVAWDHPNLMVVDASSFVSSAAVNPGLTVAALSLRAAEFAKTYLGEL